MPVEPAVGASPEAPPAGARAPAAYVAPRALQRFLCLDDFEPAARARLPRPLFGYVSGATETNASLRDNRAAFEELAFLPRMLVNVAGREQSVELFGTRYSSPFGIAPMGISALTAYRGDLAQARAAAAAGVPMVLSSSSLIRMEEVLQQAPGTWFQAYLGRDPRATARLVERVKAAGAPVLVVTIDSAVVPNRENNVRNRFKTPLRPDLRLLWDGVTHPRWALGTFLRTLLVHGMPHFENVGAERGAPLVARDVTRDFSGREHLDWEALRDIRRRWSGPLVLKGVLHPEDVKLARAAGVDGVIVSNHGGRQLDGAVSPLRVLPAVAEAAGPVAVLADSGFRRGTDVLKALALGARAVFVGRPMNYAAAVGGEAGVAHALALLRAEIHADMGLLGLNRLAELGPQQLLPIHTNYMNQGDKR
ncbi:alpha-hydroxy acid oxidase [Azohydromonas caseinilytica]|uniref:Alpha-hydroxy-acid oxidizing protein n=1 Tax=Azohydromonas caseinilytica TaxID=2728836 RepID=A0A848FIP2_9BURK|nr:alpha-hydroxy acid oxidase [Azohydromonas caseinilytica]NML17711.1 alpha-hydroxy-acid oxidizing protein [Azohydromonas caseinilytica]